MIAEVLIEVGFPPKFSFHGLSASPMIDVDDVL